MAEVRDGRMRARGTLRATRQFPRCTRGATSIEYATIAAGVSVFIVLAVTTLGTTIQETFYDGLIGMFGS